MGAKGSAEGKGSPAASVENLIVGDRGDTGESQSTKKVHADKNPQSGTEKAASRPSRRSDASSLPPRRKVECELAAMLQAEKSGEGDPCQGGLSYLAALSVIAQDATGVAAQHSTQPLSPLPSA